MQFDEWDHHPNPSETWGVWNDFAALPMYNNSELERYMELHQRVLFNPGTAELGSNLIKCYSPETDARFPIGKSEGDRHFGSIDATPSAPLLIPKHLSPTVSQIYSSGQGQVARGTGRKLPGSPTIY